MKWSPALNTWKILIISSSKNSCHGNLSNKWQWQQPLGNNLSKTENAVASRRFDVMTPGNTKVIIVRHVINTLHIKTYSRITIRHDKQIYMAYAHLPRIYWTDQLFSHSYIISYLSTASIFRRITILLVCLICFYFRIFIICVQINVMFANIDSV